ncbi:MAG: hypothetical protein ACFB9M_09315 [Myxococcota bacterium]
MTGPSDPQDDTIRSVVPELSTGDFEPLRVREAATAPPSSDRLPTEPVSLPSSSGGRAPLYRADPGQVFRLLSAHQFDDPVMAVRELYANALDASRGRAGARIDVSLDARKLVIRDRGPGLDEASLDAILTLGRSTRRNAPEAVGRFGIGFVSIFDPALGVAQVEVWAGFGEEGIRLRFVPHQGGVSIEQSAAARLDPVGTCVEVVFDPETAPKDRIRRFTEMLREHAAYTDVDTFLNGQRLGRRLAAYVSDQLEKGERTVAERRIIVGSAVQGPTGVAAIDPARAEVEFRVHQRGLFVCRLAVPRDTGKPWIRGGFGAAHAEGLQLVTSRNGFVEDDRFQRFLADLRRLHQEASYRLVQLWETKRDSYARTILVDAIRRGLKVGNRESLLAASDDLFSSAVVRAALFRAWGGGDLRSFEELADLARQGVFRAQSFRPDRRALAQGPIFRADDAVERDIFRRLSGLGEMPAAARGELVAAPGLLSRLQDRFLSGPKAEYSLFRRPVSVENVPPDVRALVEAAEVFLCAPQVVMGLDRLLPGELPTLGYGQSPNVFGPVAAYRSGEIRFNIGHRIIRRLARGPTDLGVRGLLPILAHELAHMCHELHDLDFYRTSRVLLRTLVTAAASVDAEALQDPAPSFP